MTIEAKENGGEKRSQQLGKNSAMNMMKGHRGTTTNVPMKSEENIVNKEDRPSAAFGMTVETMLAAAKRDVKKRPALADRANNRTIEVANEPKLGARIFSSSEQQVLKRVFLENPYPSRKRLHQLSDDFGKPLEKVKTWFNNRRAKFRRLAGGEASSEKEAIQNENSSEERDGTDGNKDGKRRKPNRPGGMNDLDAEEIGSPLSPSTMPDGFTPLRLNGRPRKQCHEKAPLPTTLKNASIRVGGWTCVGIESAGPDEKAKGDGLEVKFLYGRRRVVYEFSAAADLETAIRNGGPFCKVEVLFDKVEQITFEEGRNSGFRLKLKAEPECFMQPRDNFLAYKNRLKQRLYVRSLDDNLLKIFAASNEHFIEMSPSKASYIREKLMQLEPRFSRMMNGHKTKRQFKEATVECMTPQIKVANPKLSTAGSTQTPPKARRALAFGSNYSPKSPRRPASELKLPPLRGDNHIKSKLPEPIPNRSKYSDVVILPPLRTSGAPRPSNVLCVGGSSLVNVAYGEKRE